MLLNTDTILVGHVAVLVPYRVEHVLTYHSWMRQPHLLQATASEPLTLQEEYDMQQSWQLDSNKCTFIVLSKQACHDQDQQILSYLRPDDQGHTATSAKVLSFDPEFVTRNLHAMAGDVNLFLSELEPEENDDNSVHGSDQAIHHQVGHDCRRTSRSPHDAPPATTTSKQLQQQQQQAEIDIMIAESSYQRQGLGREACILTMWYGAQQLNITRFVAKIHQTNPASLALFESMGFVQFQYVECFQEYHLELRFNSNQEMIQHLVQLQQHKASPSKNGDSTEEVVPMFLCSIAPTSTTTSESSPTTGTCVSERPTQAVASLPFV